MLPFEFGCWPMVIWKFCSSATALFTPVEIEPASSLSCSRSWRICYCSCSSGPVNWCIYVYHLQPSSFPQHFTSSSSPRRSVLSDIFQPFQSRRNTLAQLQFVSCLPAVERSLPGAWGHVTVDQEPSLGHIGSGFLARLEQAVRHWWIFWLKLMTPRGPP